MPTNSPTIAMKWFRAAFGRSRVNLEGPEAVTPRLIPRKVILVVERGSSNGWWSFDGEKAFEGHKGEQHLLYIGTGSLCKLVNRWIREDDLKI